MERFHARRVAHVPHRGVLVRGFTLIELMVVLAIIVVVTTIAITGQGSFNRSIILSNAAYDLALSFRSAEVYGLGSRATGSAANTGYGLHFDRGTPTTFLMFADSSPGPSTTSCHPAVDINAPDAKPGDCAYQSSGDILTNTYRLGNGITISKFCGYSSGAWTCSDGTVSTLDVTFTRPNTNPTITVNGSYSAAFPVTQACITLSSPQGATKFVTVSQTGRISADAAACP